MQADTARPHLSAAFLATQDDPYPAYAELRARGPLSRAELGQWLVTGHSTVSTLLRDNRLESRMPAEYTRLTLGDGPGVEFLNRIVLTRTPPDHTRLRRFIGRALGTPVVRRLTGHIGRAADELLTTALDRGRLDVVTDLAVPLPVGVVCDLIGIPVADRPDVLTRVISLAKVFDAANLTPADLRDINVALPWLHDYLGDLLSSRQDQPGGPTLAGMYWEEKATDRLAVEDFADNMLFLFHAGFETTMGLVSNGFAALLAHPDQLRRLRDEPALVPSAVEEFLRYDAPIQNVIRVAREPVEVAGVKIRAGRTVLLLLGAANRDGVVFADAERLDVTRNPNPHLGFGGGLHHCLGTALARLMSVVVFERLVGAVEVLGPAAPPVRRRHASLRSYDHLPLAVRAR
ncbi:cytochrome P450 [Micromonospora sp. HNM0581]|uniref:cytochrome P450 n=1 Tax=Micromonospora sp. HNM0581 TaxID=2716341 RepID=UPI00146EF62D|nr:cytochrome P450 [Micromonospora sp. HNM0581]NLU78270.1 cytochrome P450 [Micromonospora sp. HNM0581]